MKDSQFSIDFAGFDDWVHIFSGGRQTDSAGGIHDGNRLIENAVKTFDAAYHEPPAVLGHPTDNTPAYAWVSELKTDVKDGVKQLFAKFKDVVPEFAQAVQSGRFKKRSAAFYPDGRLRHVGWLGAMPPAVKGLADVAFEENDRTIEFEFMDTNPPQKKEKSMKFSEFMDAMKFWNKIQDDPDAEIPVFAKSTPPASADSNDAGRQFTEADLESAKKEAAEAARKETREAAAAEFAEGESARKKAEAKAKIQVLIDDGIKTGTIAPAWKAAGLAEFMENMDVEQKIEFSEGQEKLTGLDWFIGFLERLPKLVDFSEIAARDKDVKTGAAGSKLDAMVKKRIAENKDLTYSAAFGEVMTENPALATEYKQEMHQ